MANSDYEAGLTGETVGHDIFSPAYQQGALDREKKQRGGGGGSGDGGGLAGGGGPVFVAGIVIMAFLAFVLSFCTYPIAGSAVLVGFIFGVVSAGAGINGVGLVFMMAVPCYIIHRLCWPLELKTAEKSGKYRTFRQYWRIVVGTYAFHQIGILFHMKSDFPEGVPLSAYAIDLGITVLGFFLTYLNSQRLDAKYGLAPTVNAHLDRVMAPVLSRIMPPVGYDVRDTGDLRVKPDGKDEMTVAIVGGNTFVVNDQRLPLAKLLSVEQVRERRATLLLGGVFLFFATPVMVKGVFGNFYDFLPQLFGVIGLGLGIYFGFLGAVQRSPAGKLGGPFRRVELFYEDKNGHKAFETVRFATPADERLFMQANANSRRQMASAPLPQAVAA